MGVADNGRQLLINIHWEGVSASDEASPAVLHHARCCVLAQRSSERNRVGRVKRRTLT